MPLNHSLLASLLEAIKGILWSAGPRGLLVWQWLALVPMAVVALVLGRILGRVTSSVGKKLTSKTGTHWDDKAMDDLRKPIGLAWGVGLLWASLPLLDATGAAESFLRVLLRAVLFAVFFWSLLRLVEVGRQFLTTRPWARANPASRSLLQLGTRAAKVVTFVIAVIAIVSELGYPVGSLLAGLGIGGLAVALAAQKTLENVLGAFSIGFDQPFREGDFVHIEDFVATVETIGLRSTRFRTLDRTLVTIPNGRLADMRIENFAPRDRLRLACTIGVEYGTSVEQMRLLLAGLERVLRQHPKIWPDAVVVRFKEYAASSLDIEVMAWFQTSEWSEFQLIRQEVLLQFMGVVEACGCSFAFPTTTVHVARPPEADTGPARVAGR
jgi:MscS family membrane protein